jgi:hypothetical protein
MPGLIKAANSKPAKRGVIETAVEQHATNHRMTIDLYWS